MNRDIFDSLSPQDLQLYYHQNYMRVKLPNKTEYEWVFVREFGSFNTQQHEAAVQTETPGIQAYPVKAITWDFSIPDSAVYNFKNSVILFCRRPLRNTAKGITNRNSFFYNILSGVAAHGGIPSGFLAANNFEICPAHLNLLFERSAPASYARGIEKILKKQVLAYALDSRICLTQGIFSLNPSIFLKDRIIGELDPHRKEIIPLHSSFMAELITSFENTGLKVRQ